MARKVNVWAIPSGEFIMKLWLTGSVRCAAIPPKASTTSDPRWAAVRRMAFICPGAHTAFKSERPGRPAQGPVQRAGLIRWWRKSAGPQPA